MKYFLNLMVLLSWQCTAQTFSETINPTQESIGGITGYKNVITRDKAQYVVKNTPEFLTAVEDAVAGSIIYLDENSIFDLTGEQNIVIPFKVTICSNRGNENSDGALIIYNSFYADQNLSALFITSDSVRITGLRLQGGNCDIASQDHSLVQCAIKNYGLGVEIDNNELYCFDKWSVYACVTEGLYVHHNYIHHNRLEGYGYGVWLGGCGFAINETATVEANLFEANRHSLASSGHWNSWIARYNVIMPLQAGTPFDRHWSSGGTKKGGSSVYFYNNLFFNKGYQYGIAAAADTQAVQEIHHNYFNSDSLLTYERPSGAGEELKVYDNYYNGEGRTLPVAHFKAYADGKKVPLTVQFRDSSYDMEGGEIVKWIWRFGDGDYRGNESRERSPVYTFTKAGVYKVDLVVFNEKGIPGFTSRDIEVRNKKTNTLSIFLNDTYKGNLTRQYRKEILFDERVIWKDDVAGDEGWQHIIRDVTDFKGRHKIAVRFTATSDIPLSMGCYLFTDDWSISNSTLEHGDFELEQMYPPFNQWLVIQEGSSGVGTGLDGTNPRSGKTAFRLRFAFPGSYKKGTWGEVYQYVTFK